MWMRTNRVIFYLSSHQAFDLTTNLVLIGNFRWGWGGAWWGGEEGVCVTLYVMYCYSSHHNHYENMHIQIQATLVISNSKGLSETLRDIRTSKYQSCRSEENNRSNNHI